MTSQSKKKRCKDLLVTLEMLRSIKLAFEYHLTKHARGL